MMDSIIHTQGDVDSPLTPLILIHAISGLALPYCALGKLFDDDRAVYAISSPLLNTTGGKVEKFIPKSIPQLAALYIKLIKAEIQPKGPYLLGGWSFGGVLAAEMANILLAEGEHVLHVFMIDSTNPGHYPTFTDSIEHKTITALTYNAMAERVGGTEVPIWEENIDPRSSVSSESTSYTSSDRHLRDDIGSGAGSRSSGSSNISSSEEDDDDDDLFDTFSMLKDIRSHIGYGLQLMSLSDGIEVPRSGCTLIRCKVRLPPAQVIRDGRRRWIQKMQQETFLGWETKEDEGLMSLDFLEATSHDQCFDPGHVNDLTEVLRSAIEKVGV